MATVSVAVVVAVAGGGAEAAVAVPAATAVAAVAPKPRAKRVPWTAAEDAQLGALVAEGGLCLVCRPRVRPFQKAFAKLGHGRGAVSQWF